MCFFFYYIAVGVGLVRKIAYAEQKVYRMWTVYRLIFFAGGTFKSSKHSDRTFALVFESYKQFWILWKIRFGNFFCYAIDTCIVRNLTSVLETKDIDPIIGCPCEQQPCKVPKMEFLSACSIIIFIRHYLLLGSSQKKYAQHLALRILSKKHG